MKIKIKADASCGSTEIPSGEYWVSLHHESGEIFLSAGGKDIKVKATRRRVKSHSRKTDIQFACGGGNLWSLTVSTPKYGEWIAMIDYGAGGGGVKRRALT